MKTTVINQNKTEMKFPVLMIHKNDLNRDDPCIVKFFNEKSGVVMSQNETYDGIEVYENWESAENFDINQFVKFTGKIIIEQ